MAATQLLTSASHITTPSLDKKRFPLNPTSHYFLPLHSWSTFLPCPPASILIAQSWHQPHFLQHHRRAPSPCPPTRQCGTASRPGPRKTRPLSIPSPVLPSLSQVPAPSTISGAVRARYVIEQQLGLVGRITAYPPRETGADMLTCPSPQEPRDAPKLSKKERRKRKQAEKGADGDNTVSATEKSPAPGSPTPPAAAKVEAIADDLAEIDEESVLGLSEAERKEFAAKLKEAGNKAYGAKEFQKAIDLYSKAILCKPDPVYYSNRAACYNALNKWDLVVEDTTAALNLDPEYIKALNRRANAYDHLGKYSEALLDFTASCIIDSFRNEQSAQAVERLLKKFAESKAKEILATKPARLPSATFVSNYLQSFRPKARPSGLEDSVEFDEESGMGQLQLGLRYLENKTGTSYEQAAEAFDKALELGDIEGYEAFAYNMRGTFSCLKGKHQDALADLSKSIELDPTMTQSYIKRASMNLELGKDYVPLSRMCII